MTWDIESIFVSQLWHIHRSALNLLLDRKFILQWNIPLLALNIALASVTFLLLKYSFLSKHSYILSFVLDKCSILDFRSSLYAMYIFLFFSPFVEILLVNTVMSQNRVK